MAISQRNPTQLWFSLPKKEEMNIDDNDDDDDDDDEEDDKHNYNIHRYTTIFRR